VKRSSRILGAGLVLIGVSTVLAAALAVLLLVDPLPDVLDRRTLALAGLGVSVLLLLAVVFVCTGVVRMASAIDAVVTETQSLGRWTRLVGAEFPGPSLRAARTGDRPEKDARRTEPPTTTAQHRHARPATRSTPVVDAPRSVERARGAGTSRTPATASRGVPEVSRRDLDDHRTQDARREETRRGEEYRRGQQLRRDVENRREREYLRGA